MTDRRGFIQRLGLSLAALTGWPALAKAFTAKPATLYSTFPVRIHRDFTIARTAIPGAYRVKHIPTGTLSQFTTTLRGGSLNGQPVYETSDQFRQQASYCIAKMAQTHGLPL